jgi:hypothetical protein
MARATHQAAPAAETRWHRCHVDDQGLRGAAGSRQSPDRRDRLSPARQHLAYVGRNGEVALQTDDGQHLQVRDAAADLVEEWNLDLAECQSGLGGLQGRRAPALVHKLVFSMPAGTPADKVLLATQRFCREQLALRHRYAIALHTDEPHPHVHVIVKAISEQGERLNIRKATLREWREEFARHLRRVGVAANATPRFVRGETRPRKSDGIYRAARRGASTHMRNRVEAAAIALGEADPAGDPAKLRIREKRRDLERGWLATSDALRGKGHFALADQTRQFVRNLPPARTEREWLTAGLLEQTRRPRPREVELTR